MASAPNETIEDLQAELAVALQRIEELEDATSHTGVADLQRRVDVYEERIAVLEEKNNTLQSSLEHLKEENEHLTDNMNGLERGRREEQRARDEASDTINRLRQQVDRLTDELQRERSKASEAAMAGARAARDRQFHNTELDKALLENAEMRDELRALQSDLEAYRDAVSELKGQLLDAEENEEALSQTLSAANARITELTRDVQEARASAEANQNTVDAKNTEIRSLHEQLDEAARRAALDLKAANERTTAAERNNSALQQEMKALKAATRVKDLEDELALTKSQLGVMAAQRDEAMALLESLDAQVAQNEEELAEIQEKRDELVEEAVKNERKRVQELEQEVADLRLDVDDEQERCTELMSQKADVEAALASVRERLAAYERSYGLEDAVKEQEQLREAIRRRDADISRLTSTAAMQMDAYDMLEEIARRLAVKAGHGKSEDIWELYPDTDLKAAIQGTVERLRSANLELIRQNDALEAQRTKLLHQLRVHADQMGEKSLKYYGLSAEDLMKVNEFAEGLRDGKYELPVNDRTLELQEVVRKLKNQISDLQEQLYTARAQGHVQPSTTNLTLIAKQDDDRDLSSLRAQAAAQEAAARAAEAAAKQLEKQQESLTKALQKMMDENSSLRQEVVNLGENQNRRFEEIKREREAELAAMKDAEVTRLASMRAAAAAFMGTSPLTPATDDALKEIYDILRNKLDTSAPLDAVEMAALYRAFARMIHASEELSRQLNKEHERATNASAQVDALTVQLTQLRSAYEKQGGELNEVIRLHASRSEEGRHKESSHTAGGPRTQGGRAMIQRLLALSSSRLPPEDWTAEVSDAHAALVEALEELASREEEVTKYEGLINDYNEQLSLVSAQHTALLRSYVTEKANFESALAQSREREQEALARLEGLSSKANRFDELSATLECTDSSTLQTQVKKLARQVAAFEVVQPMLARKYNLVRFEVAQARAAARTAELSAMESEAHLRQRILYLELWKKGAESRLSRLTELAQTWVPGADHAKLLASFQNLQQMYADLLAAEAQLRAAYVQLRDAPRQLADELHKNTILQAELDNKLAQLEIVQQDLENAKAAMQVIGDSEARGAGFRSAMDGTIGQGAASLGANSLDRSSNVAAILSGASRNELVVALTKQQHQLSEAEVSQATLQKRAEISARRIGDLESQLLAMTSRAHIAEDALDEARVAASKAEAALHVLQAEGEVVPAAEALKLRQRISSLEDEKDVLAREITKARELADIASDQATAATALIKDREFEVAELTEQIRALSARSDDDAIIGKLQSTVLSLKANFHSFLRKHDTLRLALQRARVATLALEVAVDQRAGEMLAVKEDARVKHLALQSIVDDLRTQLRSMSRDGFTLAQAQHFNDTVRSLSATVASQTKELEMALEHRQEAEQQAEESAAQAQTLQRLCEDLKAGIVAADLRNSSLGGGLTGLSSNSSRDMVKRLTELHEQLKAEKLTTLRQRREVSALRESNSAQQKRLTHADATISGLEEKLVSLDSELRRREDEFRRQLGAAIASSAHTGAMHQELPDTIGALAAADVAGEQIVSLQEANRGLRAATRSLWLTCRRWKRWAMTLQSHVKELGPAASVILDTKPDMSDDFKPSSDLSRQLDLQFDDSLDGDDPDDDAPGHGGSGGITHQRIREHYEGEIKRLQQAAQQTIASMKVLLDKKNQTVMEYQMKLDKYKDDMNTERNNLMSEKGKGTAAAFEEQRATIERLKAALLDLQSAPAGLSSAAANQQLMDRCESLERAIDAKDRQVEELDTAVNALKQALEAAQQRALQAATRVNELEEQLRARKPLVDSVPRETSASVSELRTQLAAKDKKLKGLQASLTALKEEFVRAEEEHAAAFAQLQAQTLGKGAGKAKSREPTSEPATGAASATETTDTAFKAKVDTLLETVARMKHEVQHLKARESAAENARDALAKELDRARAELLSQRDINTSCDATERRLRSEIHRLQSELDKQRAADVSRHETAAKISADLDHRPSAPSPPALSSAPDPVKETKDIHSSVDVPALVRRVRVLEAQNAALKSATAEAARIDTSRAALPPAVPPMLPSGPDTPTNGSLLPAIAKARSSKPTLGLMPEEPEMTPRANAANTVEGVAEERLRNALEGERKAKKRAELLQGKLNEKQKEVDAAKAAEAGAAAALARVKGDKDALEKRVLLLQKRQATLDAATTAALEEIEPLSELKEKLFQAEETIRQLTAQCEIELPAHVGRLEAELQGERKRASAAELASLELQDRVRSMEVGRVDGANELNALRTKLSESRRTIAALETSILTKDVSIHELQNEVDANREALEKLRRRIAEMNAYAVIASRGKPEMSVAQEESKRSGPSKPSASSSTGKSRREVELEDALTAVKRVNEKQKLELDKLRRPASTKPSAATPGLPDAAASNDAGLTADADAKLKDAQAEIIRLRARIASMIELGPRQTAAPAASSSEDAQLREARAEIARLNKRVEDLSAAADAAVALREELRATRSQLQASLPRALDAQASAPVAAGARALHLEPEFVAVVEQVRALKEENAKLMEELSAFDVNFFEEIEDLKWKYAQAVKKCKAFDEYVRLHPPT